MYFKRCFFFYMLYIYTHTFFKSTNGWVNIYFEEKVSSPYLIFYFYLVLKKGVKKFTRVRRIVLPLQTIHLQRFSHWWKIAKWNYYFFPVVNNLCLGMVSSPNTLQVIKLNWRKWGEVIIKKVNLWKYCYLFHSIINTYWHLHVRPGKANH